MLYRSFKALAHWENVDMGMGYGKAFQYYPDPFGVKHFALPICNPFDYQHEVPVQFIV